MSVNLGTAYGKIELDTTGFARGIKDANNQLETFKTQAGLVASGFKGVGDSMTKVGSTLTKTVTMPVVGLGTAAVKTGMEFDAGMSKVAAISGATGKDFDALREKAREMGATTKFTATESAEAMNYMAMAGWKTEEMLEGIEGIMNLAAASGEDLATTSDIVTDALTAFGLEAKDSSHFADVLAAAAANSNTNVAMMGESFKYVASQAGAMGYSIEDVSVALGLMANSGVKASMGGTALRNVITNLAKPTEQVKVAMTELGISLQDDEGNVKSLNQLMKDLRASLGNANISVEEYTESYENLTSEYEKGNLTTKQYEKELERLNMRCFQNVDINKAMYAATIAGKHGMSGLLAIVNATEKDFNDLNEAIYTASEGEGMAAKQAAIMMGNLKGSITILKSALQDVAIQIYEVLMPHVSAFVEKVQGLVKAFSELSIEQKEQIVKWAAIAAAIGPALLIVGKLLSGIGGLISKSIALVSWLSKAATAFGWLSGTATSLSGILSGLATAAGPILAVIAAVVALGVALKALYDQGGQFAEAVDRIKESIGSGLTKVVENAKAAFDKFKSAVSSIIEGIKSSFDFSAVDGAMGKLVDALGRLMEAMRPVMEFLMNIVGGTVGTAVVALFTVISGVINSVISALAPLIDTITSIIDVVTDVVNIVTGLIEGIITGDFTKLMDAVSSLGEDLRAVWDNWIATIKALFTGFFEGIGIALDGFFGGLGTKIGNFFTNLWNTIVNFFTVTVPEAFLTFVNETLPNFIESVRQWFEQLPYNIGYAIGFALEKLRQWGADMIAWAAQTIPVVIDNIINFFKTLPERIHTWLSTAITRIKSWGVDMKNKAKDIGKTFVDNLVNLIKTLPDKIWSWVSTIPSKILGIKSSMHDAGAGIFNSLWEGMKQVWENIMSWFEGVVSKVKDFVQGIKDGMADANSASAGSHADGLAYVPYNGYKATLHEGERVLTRNEAANYNGSGSGVTYNITFQSPKAIDPYEASRLFQSTIRKMEEGFA